MKAKSNTYQVFARKYRPQGFGDLIGQEAVSKTLKNAIDAGRCAHAYLFFGPRGTGKTTTARILAKALNCEKGPTSKSCDRCAACVEITAGNAIDVLEIDAASHTQVDKIREVVLESVSLRPARDRYKIFILDEAHMLSASSFNALLKTIEEPPDHVVFMLATTEATKIPATIFSRCQRFRFRPMHEETIVAHLKSVAKKEKLKASGRVLSRVAKAAGGSMRDALSLLDQAVSVAGPELDDALVADLLGQLPEEVLERAASALLAEEPKALWKVLEGFFGEGYDGLALLRGLQERFHSGFLAALEVQDDLEGPWKKVFADRPAKALAYVERRLGHVLEQARREPSPRATVELGLLGLMDEPFDLQELVGRLEGLERRLRGGGDVALPSAAGSTASAPPPASSGSKKKANESAEPAVVSASESALPTTASAVADPGEIWRSTLNWFRKEQPRLHGFLRTARLETGGRTWKLFFSGKFELAGCERSASAIESKIQEIAGRRVGIEFKLTEDASTGRASAPMATGSKLKAASPGSHQWEEVPEEDPIRSESSVQTATEIFGGTLKRPPPSKK